MNRIARRSTMLFLPGLLLVLAACQNFQPPPPINAPPTVVATDPADGDTNVALNGAISITFSEAMNQAATQAAVSFVPPVSCAFSWDPTGTTLTCQPTANLAPNTLHTGTVTTAATDLAAASLAKPFSFSFTSGDQVLQICVFDDPASTFDNCVLAP